MLGVLLALVGLSELYLHIEHDGHWILLPLGVISLFAGGALTAIIAIKNKQ